MHTGQFDIVGSCGGAGSTSTFNQPCYVDQVLSTTPGQTYNMSLFLKQYAGSTPGVGGFSVFFGGKQITDQLFAPVDFDWTEFTLSNLLATGTQTDLQIHLRQDLGELFLDDVSVTASALPPAAGAAPEPASWAMMVVGFGLLGAGLRQQKRRMAVRYV